MQPHRLLDETEQRFHQNFLHYNGNTQVTTLITVPGCVSSERAIKSFDKLVLEYEFLRQKIMPVCEDQYGFFEVEGKVQLQPYDLPLGLSPDALLKFEMNRLLADEESWRSLVVADHELDQTHILLTRNHAISDGYSTARVVNSLLDYLGETPSTHGCMPASAFYIRLSHWNESPIVTNKPSYADFLRLEISTKAEDRIGLLSLLSGFSKNVIWGGVLACSYFECSGVPAFDLYTAYTLRAPSSNNRPLSKACLIEVRKKTLEKRELDVCGYIERYADAVAEGKAELGKGKGTSVENCSRPALAFTNTGRLEHVVTHSKLPLLRFLTVVNRSGGNYRFVLHLGRLNNAWCAALAFSSLSVKQSAALALKAQIESAIESLPDTLSTS